MTSARTERVSLLAVGVLTNRLVLAGVAFELVFSAVLVATPGIQGIFGTAVPPLEALLILPFFPLMLLAIHVIDADLSWPRKVVQAALLMGFFLPFSYFMDSLMWRAAQRRLERTDEKR